MIAGTRLASFLSKEVRLGNLFVRMQGFRDFGRLLAPQPLVLPVDQPIHPEQFPEDWRDRLVLLRPDLQHRLSFDLTLPLDPSIRLADVLHHNFQRFTPFCQEETYWVAGNEIVFSDAKRIAIHYTPRNAFEPALEEARKTGVKIDGISFEVGVRAYYFSSRFEIIKKYIRFHRTACMFGLMLLVLVVGISHFFARLEAIETKERLAISQLVLAARNSSPPPGQEALTSFAEVLRVAHPSPVQLYAFALSILPDEAAILSLNYAGGKLSLQMVDGQHIPAVLANGRRHGIEGGVITGQPNAVELVLARSSGAQ